MSSKQNNDDDDSVSEIKIVRESNPVYFEVSRESVFTLTILLREAAKFVHAISFDLNVRDIPVYLHVNSHGGSLYDAYAVVDTIVNLRVPVYSIVEGCTASAGTIISMVCQRRFICANAYMLIHQLSSNMLGTMSELKDKYTHLTKLMDQIKILYGKHTKIPAAELMELLEHELWLTPETCVQYGLVDGIYDSSV